MKFSNIISLLLLLVTNGILGQVNTKIIEFDNLDKKLELNQDDIEKTQTLLIKTNSGELIKEIEIDQKTDPYSFREFYKGERNFAIVGGRYKFFIINVSTNILIGPFRCCCRIEPLDAQTGVLYAYRIIQNGQYLLVNALDNGLTCYNLSDLYNPKEIEFFKSDSNYSGGKYVFIDHRKENIYNGISASCGNYDKNIDSELIFQGYKFELNNESQLKYKISDNKIMTLAQLDDESNVINLKIDLENGKIIE